jgi:ubiquinone/menaquinone biosynthesis C-methylase UbiE
MESVSGNKMRGAGAEAGRLGIIEFLAMNNPARRFLQRRVEFALFNEFLRTHSIDLNGGVIMDAGCGSGYSTELIVKEYAPSRIIAFDLMPEQIRLARKRGLGIDFFVGDMTDIDVPDGTCDAVFIFGVLHHVPNWKDAVAEVVRTLKPGGVLLVEEPPYGFTLAQLEKGLRAAGLTMLESRGLLLRTLRTYLWRK